MRVKEERRPPARRPALPRRRSPIAYIHPPYHREIRCISPCRPTLSAGPLDDLHSFDPATMTWTLLSPANDAVRPSTRANHGFTSAAGRLYVHGGFGVDDSGGYGEAKQGGCVGGG